MSRGMPPEQVAAETAATGSAQIRQVLERIGREEKRWSLTDRHDLGVAVKEVHAHQAGSGESTYAKGVTDKLAEDLALDAGLLRKVMRFAELFSRQEAERLDGTTLSNGKPFSWSHVRRLLEAPDAKVRRSLVRQTVAGGWTSEQLAEVIQRRKGGKGNKGGRRPLAPRRLEDRVAQERRALDEWLSRDRQLWSRPEYSLEGMAAGLAPGEAAEDVVKELMELRGNLECVQARLKDRRAEVDAVLAKLTRRPPARGGKQTGPRPSAAGIR